METRPSLTRRHLPTPIDERRPRISWWLPWSIRTKRRSEPTSATCNGRLSANLPCWVRKTQRCARCDKLTSSLDDPSALSVTPELDEPIRIIKRNFEFLIKALSVAALRRVWRQVLEKLQTALWSGVLMRQSFTTLGAAQFAHDCGVLSSLVESYLPSGSGALASLQEGLVLLALPAASPSAESANEDAEPRMTLKEASDRAFKDNDGARGLLEEMHLEALTPVDARGVLERRVENNEAMGW